LKDLHFRVSLFTLSLAFLRPFFLLCVCFYVVFLLGLSFLPETPACPFSGICPGRLPFSSLLPKTVQYTCIALLFPCVDEDGPYFGHGQSVRIRLSSSLQGKPSSLKLLLQHLLLSHHFTTVLTFLFSTRITSNRLFFSRPSPFSLFLSPLHFQSPFLLIGHPARPRLLVQTHNALFFPDAPCQAPAGPSPFSPPCETAKFLRGPTVRKNRRDFLQAALSLLGHRVASSFLADGTFSSFFPFLKKEDPFTFCSVFNRVEVDNPFRPLRRNRLRLRQVSAPPTSSPLDIRNETLLGLSET